MLILPILFTISKLILNDHNIYTTIKLYNNFEDQLCNSIPILCSLTIDDLEKVDEKYLLGLYKDNHDTPNLFSYKVANIKVEEGVRVPDLNELLLVKNPPPLTELKVRKGRQTKRA